MAERQKSSAQSAKTTTKTNSSAAVRGRLVGDFPNAIDPDQVVEIDIPLIGIGRTIPAELHRSGVPHLRYRNYATDDAPAGRRSPLLEIIGNQIFMQLALGVNIEDPCVFVKCLPEHVNVVLVESVSIELHDT